MLPALRDEELMAEIVAVSAGSGTLAPDSREALMRALRRKAEPQRQASLDGIRALGINVREV